MRCCFHVTLQAICIVLLGSIFDLRALADTETQARKYIQKAYDSMAAAQSRNDLEGSMAFWTPDFRMYGSNKDAKGMSRSEYKKAATGFQGMKAYKEKDTIIRFVLKGDIAIITMTSKRHAKMTNEKAPTKILDVVGEARSVDTWIKTPKGWREKKAVAFYHHTVVDGEWIGDQ